MGDEAKTSARRMRTTAIKTRLAARFSHTPNDDRLRMGILHKSRQPHQWIVADLRTQGIKSSDSVGPTGQNGHDIWHPGEIRPGYHRIAALLEEKIAALFVQVFLDQMKFFLGEFENAAIVLGRFRIREVDVRGGLLNQRRADAGTNSILNALGGENEDRVQLPKGLQPVFDFGGK